MEYQEFAQVDENFYLGSVKSGAAALMSARWTVGKHSN